MSRNWLSNSAKIAVQTAIKLADMDPQIIDHEHDNSNLCGELNFYTYMAEEKAFLSTIKFNFLWPSDVVFLDEFLEVCLVGLFPQYRVKWNLDLLISLSSYL